MVKWFHNGSETECARQWEEVVNIGVVSAIVWICVPPGGYLFTTMVYYCMYWSHALYGWVILPPGGHLFTTVVYYYMYWTYT